MMVALKRPHSPTDDAPPMQYKKPKKDATAQDRRETCLTSLPEELIEQIVSYVLPHNETISVTERVMSTNKRRWTREVEALQGPPTLKRRVRIHRGTTAVLQTCQLLHKCGIVSLWRENTYLFDRYQDIVKWLSITSEGPKLTLRKLELGPNNTSWRDSNGHRNMDWPYNFEILASLPELRELILHLEPSRRRHVNYFGISVPTAESPKAPKLKRKSELTAQGWSYWALGRSYAPTQWACEVLMPNRLIKVLRFLQSEQEPPPDPALTDDHFGLTFEDLARDYMLRTIPGVVLDRLERLEVAWRVFDVYRIWEIHSGNPSPESEDRLAYAKALPRIVELGG